MKMEVIKKNKSFSFIANLHYRLGILQLSINLMKAPELIDFYSSRLSGSSKSDDWKESYFELCFFQEYEGEDNSITIHFLPETKEEEESLIDSEMFNGGHWNKGEYEFVFIPNIKKNENYTPKTFQYGMTKRG